MAGDNTLKPADTLVPKPSVKTFSCKNCGAAVQIKSPGTTMSVSCNSCHSLIDTSDESYKILYQCKGQFATNFPIGTRGKLKGTNWECVGFLVRMDEASGYTWSEYLLYNPYQGYRWLTENSGHWSFVKMIKRRPSLHGSSSEFTRKATLDDRSYRLFYSGTAKIVFVQGEFYWLVKAGQSVVMKDFISPPLMLSSEKDDHEWIWSVSEYVAPSEILNAFKVAPVMMPTPAGVGANQPSYWSGQWSKIKPLWLCFMLILTVAEFAHLATAANRSVLTQSYEFAPNAKSRETTTTPVFSLAKDRANLLIGVNAAIDNSWFYIDGELVNNSTGETYPFDTSVEYYHGFDGGEAWSEGSTQSTRLLSSVPSGDYYINFDTESGDFHDQIPRSFNLFVKRDVPTYASYFWCLFFLSIFPALIWLASNSEETMRWSQSDYSPYSKS